MRKIIIYCLIFTLILIVHAKDLRSEQEEYSQLVRELARIHYIRARNYYYEEEYSMAKAEFQTVLKLNPEHQGALWYLKCTEKELAKLPEQKKVFTGLSPTDMLKIEKQRSKEKQEKIDQLYKKGKDCFNQGLYSEAIDCFEKVTELAGANP